jgi:hypothetical protein
MKTLIILLLTCSLSASVLSAPQLESGLQLYFLPVKLAKPGHTVKGGFTVVQPKSKEEIAGVKADRILRYFRSLPESVQTNGIWVRWSLPKLYSGKERAEMCKLVEECSKSQIPLFSRSTYGNSKINMWVSGCPQFTNYKEEDWKDYTVK